MAGFLTNESIAGLNSFVKSKFKTIAIALLICTFVDNLQPVYTIILGEPVTAFASDSTKFRVISEHVKSLVKELEYSDKVADDFVTMVFCWQDENGEPVLVNWKNKLDRAKEDYNQGKMSEDQLARVNQSITEQLCGRITKEIGVNEEFFELIDIVKHRQTQCLGYSQLVYILGNSVGLLVKPIKVPIGVTRLVTGQLAEAGHIGCMVYLPDGRKIMVDLTTFSYQPISKPFVIEKEFIGIGNCWELRDKDNPLGVHRSIQILGGSGLTAGIYCNRANEYCRSGSFRQAVAAYIKTIELYPQLSEAYYNRGGAYERLGQYNNALLDYTMAIKHNPKFFSAYNNRGRIYVSFSRLAEAVSDFTQTIKLNSEDIEAYYNRGCVYNKLQRYREAVTDYTTAIQLMQEYKNPDSELSNVYNCRGLTYLNLCQYLQAISDFNKSIELNPGNALSYNNRGLAYALLGKREKAREDIIRVDRLDPVLVSHIE